MPRVNPIDLVGSTVEQTVRGSAAVADRWYDEMARLETAKRDVESLARDYKGQGVKPPRELHARLRQINRDFKLLEGQVARYSNASLKDISSKLEVFEGTPGAAFYGELIRDMKRGLMRAKKKAQFRGADVREDINQLRGDLATLKQGLPVSGTTGVVTRGRVKAKGKMTVREAYKHQVKRWREVQRGMKLPRDRHLVEVSDWIDLQIKVINRRIARGELDENVKSAIKRLAGKISEIGAVTRKRVALKTAAEARKLISAVRRKAVAMRKKTRRAPKEIAALEADIEAVASGFHARDKTQWSTRDEKAIAEDIRNLKAVAAAMAPAKGRPKHPTRLKTGNPKKKAKKKKTARKTTPAWQRLIRRCQKLWEHYCERPSKKRLQDVLKHMETMKQSTTKKVVDEYEVCLRAVNKEKKRWKLK